MQLTIEEAQTRLTDLIATAESGTEVILTRNGRPAACLIPLQPAPPQHTHTPPTPEDFLAKMRAIPVGPGFDDVCAAQSQDFLYDDEGLPA